MPVHTYIHTYMTITSHDDLLYAMKAMPYPAASASNLPQDAMPPPRIVLGRTHSAQESRNSHDLLSAIEDGNINSVRSVLLMIPAADASVLTTPSLMAEHSQRTPLMAAAFNGSLVIFTTLIHHFNRVYPETVRKSGNAMHTRWACKEPLVS